MQNKYYTPEIEEFHVGFECEFKSYVNDGNSNFVEQWDKRVISCASFYEDNYESISYKSNWRVKYLDEDDILDLGFEYTNNKRDLVKDNIRIRTYIGEQFEVPNVCIYCVRNFRIFPKEELLIFKGKIKNKSELKRILKMLIL